MSLSYLPPFPDSVPVYTGSDWANVSYSGQEIRASAFAYGRVFPLGNLYTISVSTHRPLRQVRGFGQASGRGHSRGFRTVAGQMVFSQWNKDALFDMISVRPLDRAASAWHPATIDQAPPFTMVLQFATEVERHTFAPKGEHADHVPSGSRLILYGVELESTGSTMSVDDLVTEAIFHYQALAVSPLHDVGDSPMTGAAGLASRTSSQFLGDLRQQIDAQRPEFQDPRDGMTLPVFTQSLRRTALSAPLTPTLAASGGSSAEVAVQAGALADSRLSRLRALRQLIDAPGRQGLELIASTIPRLPDPREYLDPSARTSDALLWALGQRLGDANPGSPDEIQLGVHRVISFPPEYSERSAAVYIDQRHGRAGREAASARLGTALTPAGAAWQARIVL